MRIGIPSETKNSEGRVAATPAGVHRLVEAGHEVVVQRGAGLGSAIGDDEFAHAGAALGTADEAWAQELVLKVKEPTPAEYGFLRDDLVLFGYLHLAADEALTRALLDAGTTAIAYESVRGPDGSAPLLAPMSEVAGRLAITAGAWHLLSPAGGRGTLLAGVPGTPPADVLVIGGGQAGTNAAAQAVGLGASVTVADVSMPRLREIDERFAGRVRTVASTPYELERLALASDLVVGAVLVPGARAPRLLTTAVIERMRPGSVLVDIAIDQGGCFEPSRPTTHDDPVIHVGRSLLYAVTNMPGAAAATATPALTNATLGPALRIADAGWRAAAAADPGLAAGVSTADGAIACPAVAATFPSLPSVAVADLVF